MRIKSMRKKKEAVSPVIATILMVAITVVLAAVLYVMVSGMMNTSNAPKTPLAATASKTSTGAVLQISESSDTGQIDGTTVTVVDQNKAIQTITGANLTDALGTVVATYSAGTLTYTGSGTGYYEAGMRLVIDGDFDAGYKCQLNGDGFALTEVRIS